MISERHAENSIANIEITKSFRQSLEYVNFHIDSYITYSLSNSNQYSDFRFHIFSCRLFPDKSQSESFPLTWPRKSDFHEYNPIDDLFSVLFILLDQHDRLLQLKEWYVKHVLHYRKQKMQHSLFNIMGELLARLDDLQVHIQSLSPISIPTFPSDECIMYLLDQSYLRIIDENPTRLNKVSLKNGKQYLYGELRSSLIASIFRDNDLIPIATNIGSELPIFMDMGSGIGHVVLQVASMTRCHAIGIEILPFPFRLSLLLKQEFIHRLKLFGYKSLSDHVNQHVELIQGNFLENQRVISVIEHVHTILVNNFTFGSVLNQELMDLFLGLSEGAKIISLINFTPLRKRLTDYHRSRPNSIFSIEQISYPPDSVSWSSASGYYYIHTVDRESLSRDIEYIKKKRFC